MTPHTPSTLAPFRCAAGRRARSRVAATLLTLVSSIACGSGAPVEPAASAEPAAGALTVLTLTKAAQDAGGVTVAAVRAEPRVQFVDVPAVLQVDETRTARVGALVDGVVVDVSAQVGARVNRGARLAAVHSDKAHEAWANHRRALAERRRAATELAFLTEAEARAGRLFADKAVSRQDVERARTSRSAGDEALVIAESEVTRARDELDHLGLDPGTDEPPPSSNAIPIAATQGGVVLERHVTAGTAVTVGTPLFTVSDLSRLWALAEIDESRLADLAVGRTTALTVAAYPDRTFSGHIAAIGDSVNPETRRVTARIEVLNADGRLKPYMLATVRLPTAEPQEVVVVPASALQKIDQRPVVFVEETPGRFTRRDVVPGTEVNGYVEIDEGLEPSERVATAGTFLLKSMLLAGPPQ